MDERLTSAYEDVTSCGESPAWVVAEGRETYYDLEERTFEFARDVRAFVKRCRQTAANTEDGKQLIRSSGSVGANYIEANEAVSGKDFLFRIKLCRKEAKESRYWLRLLDLDPATEHEKERNRLIQEATELMNIFGSICRKSEAKQGKDG